MEIKRENSTIEFLVYMKIIKTENFDRNVQSDCIPDNPDHDGV